MTPTYRQVTYDEAHAASERGEVVEYRRAGGQAWHPFGLFNGSLQQCGYEFRVLDPYAVYKDALKEGKIVEILCRDGSWKDTEGKTGWGLPPDHYRIVEPDPYAELKAAQDAGKVIQMTDGNTWTDLTESIEFCFPQHFYRIKPDPKPDEPDPYKRVFGISSKPDELVIEPGKFKATTYEEAEAAFRSRSNVEMSDDGRAWHPFGFKSFADAGIQFRVITSEGGILAYEQAKIAHQQGYKVEMRLNPSIKKENGWTDACNYFSGDPAHTCFEFRALAPWTDTPAPYDNWDKVPAWHKYQARGSSGRWYSIELEPTLTKYGWDGINQGLAIPDKYAPTNFTGTWQTSLQARPAK